MQNPKPVKRASRAFPLIITAAVVIVLGAGTFMVHHAESTTNQEALADQPKPVTVVAPQTTTYRASRAYVGTIEPWFEAKIGPQLVSAYVSSVLVRPGASVKRGDVLATLDCRNAHAGSKSVEMQARALEARQKALSNEAARIGALLQGGFVSPNEAEQKSAQSAAEQAQLLAQQAKMLGSSLQVDDCVLRAPFDGEVATRSMDPGGFVQPGASIVTIVDRSTVRVVASAPEIDFDAVAPGTPVTLKVLATRRELQAKIARRAPAALASTRTVSFELDVPDAEHDIPVGTTSEIHIEVGQPRPVVSLPLAAAAVRNGKASVFVVEGNVVHSQVLRVEGERAGQLFLEPKLAPGARVVREGRELLVDGDIVAARVDPDATASVPRTAAGAVL